MREEITVFKCDICGQRVDTHFSSIFEVLERNKLMLFQGELGHMRFCERCWIEIRYELEKIIEKTRKLREVLYG